MKLLAVCCTIAPLFLSSIRTARAFVAPPPAHFAARWSGFPDKSKRKTSALNGVCLAPIDKDVEDEFVSWWQWRPTVEIIESFNLIDEELIQFMGFNAGVEITSAEANAIAHRIETEILEDMPPDGRVKLDLSVTTGPDDGTFYRNKEELQDNYSAHASWLEKFVAFCKRSGGFRVT